MFPRKLTPEVLQALRGVRFIAQHIKDADKDNEVNMSTQERFIISLMHISILGVFLDCPRMEICFDGFGSIFVVGFHIELYWWHDRHHFQQSFAIRFTQIIGS